MSGMATAIINAEVIEAISRILKKGNSAELKRENGKLVVVEIERKVKTKTSINGQRETVNRDYELNRLVVPAADTSEKLLMVIDGNMPFDITHREVFKHRPQRSG